MTLPQARARVPKLVARGRDRECERAAEEALLEVAEMFSPRVEDEGEGVVYLDLEGHAALRTSPLAALARDILRAAEKALLPARVGVAASKLAARVAAGLPDTPTVVPEGEESRFLAPLPLEKLAPALEIAATLDRWGLHSIGDFAKLPEGEVASRLGEVGRELHATARGIDPRPLEPYLPPPSFSEGMDLEWPLATLEPFLFVAHAALERLVRRLESQALACTRLEVSIKLDPDGHDARAIALPAPTRDVKTLLTLVRLELEARPPGAPVAGFSFSAHPDSPRRAQLSLFGPAALSPDRLATTIARLAALLGADRVGSPRSIDGHRPERFTDTGYAPPPPPHTRLPPREGRGLLGVRVLRPAVALEVLTTSPGAVGAGLVPARSSTTETEAGGHKGRPYDTRETHGREGRPYELKSAPDAAPPISGSVRVAAGPWSLEDGWWTDAPADRDYWDVELSDGGLYRIYRERAAGAWFADGVYD
jgi:protein ImuB